MSENFCPGFWELWSRVLTTLVQGSENLCLGFWEFCEYCISILFLAFSGVLRTLVQGSENLCPGFWELWSQVLRTLVYGSEKFAPQFWELVRRVLRSSVVPSKCFLIATCSQFGPYGAKVSQPFNIGQKSSLRCASIFCTLLQDFPECWGCLAKRFLWCFFLCLRSRVFSSKCRNTFWEPIHRFTYAERLPLAASRSAMNSSHGCY